MASDDENWSARIMSALWPRSPALTASLHMAPDEINTARLEMSQRSGSASRAWSMGRANGSPTQAIELTFSRSIVSSSSIGS